MNTTLYIDFSTPKKTSIWLTGKDVTITVIPHHFTLRGFLVSTNRKNRGIAVLQKLPQYRCCHVRILKAAHLLKGPDCFPCVLFQQHPLVVGLWSLTWIGHWAAQIASRSGMLTGLSCSSNGRVLQYSALLIVCHLCTPGLMLPVLFELSVYLWPQLVSTG